jgi:Ring finger domain
VHPAPEGRKKQRSNSTTSINSSSPGGTGSRSGSFIVAQSNKRLLKSLSNVSGESEQVIPSCAICLDPFTVGQDICISQNDHCPHQFHLTCAFEWLLKSQECPCCRRDYLTVGQQSSTKDLVKSATTVPTSVSEIRVDSRSANDATNAVSSLGEAAKELAHRSLTAEEILARVKIPLDVERPSTDHGRAPRRVRNHQGLTARQLLAGLTPEDVAVELEPQERAHQEDNVATDEIRVHLTTDAETSPANVDSGDEYRCDQGLTDVEMGIHLTPPTRSRVRSLMRTPPSSRYGAVTARQMLAGEVPISPLTPPSAGNGRSTARQVLAGEVPGSGSLTPPLPLYNRGLTARQMLAGEVPPLATPPSPPDRLAPSELSVAAGTEFVAQHDFSTIEAAGAFQPP